MRPVQTVAVYFGVVFLGGALLAPWLYELLQWIGGTVPSVHALAKIPFPRCLNRSLMIVGLVGLWPVACKLELRSWAELGLKKSTEWWRGIAGGFGIGCASLAVVALAAWVSGARTFDSDRTSVQILWHAANAGSAAVAVSFVEELFFRGLLLAGLRKVLDWRLALAVSSLIYAGLHFLQRTELSGAVNWKAGFIVLGSMLQCFGDLDLMIPGFLNLTLTGVLLGFAYHRTGALYLPIGLHAGWIFWLKSYGFLSREGMESGRWFWGTNKLIDGFLASVVLIIMLGLFVRNYRQLEPARPARTKPNP